MRVVEFRTGFAIQGDSTTASVVDRTLSLAGSCVPLVIADPPYGNVLADAWDRWEGDEASFVDWMLKWTESWQRALLPDAALYVWGGVGTPGFRPFFSYLSRVERETSLRLANLITWKKRRAYGVQHNYLFTREECVYLINGPDVKRPRRFNVPLLDELRGYAGFDPKHPAKSEFYRRSNVWTDVTEVMRGKVHPAQKAPRVIEVPIEVHTTPGEWVVDPFAGSGTTALAAIRLGRRFVVVEACPKAFETMVERIHVKEASLVVASDNANDQAPSPVLTEAQDPPDVIGCQ